MPASGNRAPNQNDLFEIFRANVEVLSALNEVIVKGKIDKKVAQNIQTAAEVIADSAQAIFDAVSKMGEFDAAGAEKAMKSIEASGKAINSIVSAMDMIAAINSAKVRSARKGVAKLYTFLFGKDKRGLFGKNMGLFSLLEKAGDKKYKGVITDGAKNLDAVAQAIKPFNAALVVIGISAVPLALSILSLWLMSKAVKILIGIFVNIADKSKEIDQASQTMMLIAGSLALFTLALVVVGLTVIMALPLIAAAILTVFAMVGLMILLSNMNKYVQGGADTLEDMAIAIAIIGLTALVLALTGQFITANWESFLIITAFLVVLIGAFLLVGAASKHIDKGSKELLYIALTVGILAVTAILCAMVGQFIEANWEGFLMISAFLVVLIGAFWLVGKAAKKIEKGGAELLYIALTVGILAIVAVLMVFVGSLITANWEGILAISVMIMGMVALMWGVAKLSKDITKGLIAMGVVVVAMILIATAANMFCEAAAKLAALGGVEEFLIVVGVMGVMVLGVAGIAIGLGALVLSGIGGAALAAGVAAMAGIAAIIMMLGEAMLLFVDAAKGAQELKGDPKELTEQLSLPVEVAANIAKIVMALDVPIGPAAARVGALRDIIKYVGRMAETLQKMAAMTMPVAWDKDGKPIEFVQMKGKDFADAAVNAAGILGCATAMFADSDKPLTYTFADGTPATVQSVSLAAIDNIGFGVKIKIKRLGKIIGVIGNMADTLQHIASLSVPDGEFDENGKGKKWRQMTGDDFANASLNSSGILRFFVGMFGDEPTQIDFSEASVTSTPLDMATLDKISLGVTFKVKKLNVIVGTIGNMAETLQHIASLSVPDGEFDENGKGKKWRQMTGEDFVSASLNASGILRFFVAMFADEASDIEFSEANAHVEPLDMVTLDNIGAGVKRKVKRLGAIVGVISGMADTLQHIASLSVPDCQSAEDFTENGAPKKWREMTGDDFQKACMNTGGILKFFVSMFGDEITDIQFSDGNIQVNPLDTDTLDNIGAGVRRKVVRLGEIVQVVGGMAEVLQHVASLSVPDAQSPEDFNENGAPKKWREMVGKDFEKACMNTGGILKFFVSMFGEEQTQIDFSDTSIMVSPLDEETLDNISSGVTRKVKRLGSIVEVVGGMAETLQKMASLTVPDAQSPEDFNENGTPKKWRQMTAQDIGDAALMAGSLLQFFCALFGETPTTLSIGSQGTVTVIPISEEALDNIGSSTERKMKAIGAAVSAVSGMSEMLTNLGSCIIPDIKNPETDIDQYGHALKWKQVDVADAFDNAKDVIWKILTGLVGILGDETLSDDLEDLDEDAMENLALVMQGISGLTSVVDLIKMLAGGGMATRYIKDTREDSPTYGQMIPDPDSYMDMASYINSNYGKIKRTIKTLLEAPIYAIRDITEDESFMKAINKSSVWIKDITGISQAVITPVKELTDLFKNELKDLDEPKVRSSFAAIIDGPLEALSKYDHQKMWDMAHGGAGSLFLGIMMAMCGGKDAKGSMWNGMASINESRSALFQANVREVNSLMKQLQSTDVNKLKYASNIMEKMTEFARSINGDFKELAHCINEDLITALEKLEETLGKVSEGISIDVSTNLGDTIQNPSGTPGKDQKDQKEDPNIKEIAQDIQSIKKVINQLKFNGSQLRTINA